LTQSVILTENRGSTAHLILPLLFNRYLIGMLKNRMSIRVSFRDRFSIDDRCRGRCAARACR
jgi:hypothetical protein